MLYCRNARHATHLPMYMPAYLGPKRVSRTRTRCRDGDRLKILLENNYDLFLRTLDLLSFKSSSFLKGQSVSERDLMFENHTMPLSTENFSIVLQWLLTMSAWRASIRTFDETLQRLSNTAMSEPSLDIRAHSCASTERHGHARCPLAGESQNWRRRHSSFQCTPRDYGSSTGVAGWCLQDSVREDRCCICESQQRDPASDRLYDNTGTVPCITLIYDRNSNLNGRTPT